ncbi:acyl CoA--acetate/3-ketoacid CoA transferase subunit alpha [Streptomyces sp. NBC_01795]|uniref:CoA transferase subunit A n=1 Tax=unclassified Streptomyces TaxID=2593676 RepID=UPI002DD9274C|nr:MULTISPECIES: CoA-transferase [unclassified Streptomyces]WSA92420.1 acyl CoA--acetate/3-ketoacid CoA transferase subunit alpha [Streptomyces sp. NBC_01795]WSB76787.1 acyl CoA--acetate/3-ketoacid CoA transferase subunit alpha [Streptomyces sp. NBC_01775]WSS14936.1 acyl CoA--acetate/3-ketoacid CoA transferase subunit alpha [Streptomyces sp. NBC_01186]
MDTTPKPPKPLTLDQFAARIESGSTLGIGGWGARRKPMALVRALLRTDVTDLTVISCGGPDVGLLAAAGRIRKLVAPFVTLDSVPLEPHFRTARQSGAFAFEEWDESMFLWGLTAAAHRLPFMPVRGGLGSDVPRHNPRLRTVTSPYEDGETLMAAPALRMDAALVHMNRADRRGNGQSLGPDPFFDDLFTEAADRAYVSCERLVDRFEGPPQTLLVQRQNVTGVLHTPHGAHFTACAPDYGRDEAFQRAYVRAAADPAAWREFEARFLAGDEAAYQRAVDDFATDLHGAPAAGLRDTPADRPGREESA